MFSRRNRIRSQDPLNLFRRALISFYSAWVSRTYPFASLGSNLSIHYRSDLSKVHAHRMKIGSSVVIEKDSMLRVDSLDDGQPILTIEDGCVIGPRAVLSAKNCIYLEPDVVIGPSVLIMDHSHAYKDIRTSIRRQGVTEGGKIRISEGCSIGQGTVIHCDRDELTLGRNCVVAPNSLVNRSFPDYSVIAGNPAHVVKQFDAAKGAWVLGSSRPVKTDEMLAASGPQPSR
jgi:acetyltransferase-like isoleucine patch superfamily enzyme